MSNQSPGVFRRGLRFIGNSLKSLAKSILSLFIRVVVLLVLVVILITIVTRPEPIKDGVALRLALQGELVEQLSFVSPLAQMGSTGQLETLVRDVTDSIDSAAKDKRIKGLVLELAQFRGGSLSKLEMVGQAISRFKESGKPVIAVADNYSQAQYFLASHADEIYLNPMGAIEITGMGSFRPYFKDALDKLKVNVHVFKVGTFKDAVEPFTRTSMSDASKEHNSEWINALWKIYTGHIESQRELPIGAINDYIANMDSELIKQGGNTAKLALSAGLVDGIATRDEMQNLLIQKIGHNGNGQYPRVELRRYIADVRAHEMTNGFHSNKKVAVVVAKGEILDGDHPSGTIGGDTLANLLKQVQQNQNYKAVVLRVDSPGGSAYASEVIRQQVVNLKKQGIPVVVSMGSVAASGGYWISANADQIWASPSTITGSIGVFGMLPTLENSLKEIGINIDGVSSTDMAGFASPVLPMNEKSNRVIQATVDGIYQNFLELVAEGRNSTPQEVHQVAQGRVWTGTRARQLGLVDHLGGLKDAINAAAQLANMTDYQVDFVEKPLTLREQILRELSNGNIGVAQIDIQSLLPDSLQALWTEAASPLVQELNALNDPKGYYLRCYDCTTQ